MALPKEIYISGCEWSSQPFGYGEDTKYVKSNNEAGGTMQITIQNPESTNWKEIPVGVFVKCLSRILFTDGTTHEVGQILKVTEDNKSYFSIFVASGQYAMCLETS